MDIGTSQMQQLLVLVAVTNQGLSVSPRIRQADQKAETDDVKRVLILSMTLKAFLRDKTVQH